MTDLTNPIFTDETAAIEHMELERWPNGAFCAHCGSVSVTKMAGQTQAGMFQCNDCRDKFTIRTGTVFERSHIPLHKWLLAMHLMSASKKGISAHQLHRLLGITYKSAWFMAHRIREAMTPDPAKAGPVGGSGVTVEADEMFLTKSKKTKTAPGERRTAQSSPQVLSLIERGGNIRSVYLDHKTVRAAFSRHLDKKSRLVTDQAQHYTKLLPYGQHESVNHSKGEYVRGDVHTNTAEGFFSLFKRGLVGTYQHIDEKHLPRYLAEFDFRQNHRAALGITDAMRAHMIIKGAEGKRLTYRQP
jgi:transposase-like protein